ncbi:MAG: DUF6600 domain-containing protein [Bryobacteraceae bacterium]
MKRWTLQLLILAVSGTAVGLAQNEGPGRGVARISVIDGDVSVRRGDSGEWIAAAVNAPLVVDDRILTGPGSRAEVQFDYANMIRIGRDAEIRLSELEHRRYQVQVAQGTTTFRVLRDSDADVDINTPSVSVRPVKRGAYRITVLADGTSEITVRSGEAEIFTPRGVERLRSGRTMVARGPASDPEYQVASDIPRDSWDAWNESRDRDLERSRTYQYVSRDIYGAEELDMHGSWINVPPYGVVWTPRVAVGWAPYRFGRWSWIDWYGWTWVSHDPWGWAPYHYGRWFWHANQWCWYPGGMHVRHMWSPALVSFVGWGGGIGVGIGFGRVGWVPLAPFEPLHPWWGPGFYGRGWGANGVTIVNNVNITNVYRNARVPNGMTAVDAVDFSRGRPGRAARLSEAELRQASMVRGALPVVPQRESLRMTDRDTRIAGGSRAFENGRFHSRRAPSAVERVSFDEQRRGMEQMTRRTFGGETAESSRGGTVTGRAERAGGGAVDRGGWRRVGEAGEGARGIEGRGGTVTGRAERAGGGAVDRGGWRRFGEPERGVRGSESDVSRPAAGNMDRGSWRRFGDPGSAPSPARNEGIGRRDTGASEGDRGNWRRFEPNPSRGDLNRGGGRIEPRGGSPRGVDRPNFGGYSGSGGSGRVGPPAVRERGSQPGSSPRMSPGPTSGGYGGARSGGAMRGGGGFEGRSGGAVRGGGSAGGSSPRGGGGAVGRSSGDSGGRGASGRSR